MNVRNILLIILGAVILVGAFIWLKPEPTEPAKQPENTLLNQPEQTETKTFELTIKENKIVSGESVIKVTRDQEVTIKFTSDVAEELHLHGYDKTLQLQPNVPGELKFRADITGRFPIELHNAEVEIGALEVAPE